MKQFQPNTSGVQIHPSAAMYKTVMANDRREMLSSVEGKASHVLST